MSFPQIITKFNKAKIHFLTIDQSTATNGLTASDSTIKEYFDGLWVAFRMPFDAPTSNSKTTLNINGLGSKSLYLGDNTKNAYGLLSGQVYLLMYETTTVSTGCWKVLNHDANSQHGYAFGTCSTLENVVPKDIIMKGIANGATYKPVVGGILSFLTRQQIPANSNVTLRFDGSTVTYSLKTIIFVDPDNSTTINTNNLARAIPSNSIVTCIYTGSEFLVIGVEQVTRTLDNSLVLKIDSGNTEGTSKYTFDGSVAKTLNIKSGTGISLTSASGSVTIANSGVRSISSGTNNGTIKVNTNGTNAEVSVAGLGSAAYTASTDYAASSHTHGNSDITSLDASKITSGTIDIARIPAAALERMIPVADQTARYALTTSDVQLGDTVKQNDTGILYLVVDTSKLNQAAGYQEYTAGSAASVPWTGVTNKPDIATSDDFAEVIAETDDHSGELASVDFVMQAHASASTSSNHSHGNISSDGKIGSTANLPLITTTSGTVTTGSFGTSANTFCEGNDTRLSDARVPDWSVRHSYTIAASAAKNWYRIANASISQIESNQALHAIFLIRAQASDAGVGYYNSWLIDVEVYGSQSGIRILGGNNSTVPLSQCRILYENTAASVTSDTRPAIDVYLNAAVASVKDIEIIELYNSGWTFVDNGALNVSTVPTDYENGATGPFANGVQYAQNTDYTRINYINVTANKTLDFSSYHMRVLNCTNTITLTIPRPNGTSNWFWIKNNGTGIITLHPVSTSVYFDNISEDLYLRPGEFIHLTCQSSGHYSITVDGRLNTGVVGRTGTVGTATKHWFLIAEYTAVDTYVDPYLSLKIFKASGTSQCSGILSAHVRIDATKGVVSNKQLQWEYKDDDLDVNNFVLSHVDTSDTSSKIQLWYYDNSSYASLKYVILAESLSSERLDKRLWKITRTRKSGNNADADLLNFDTGFTGTVTSTLLTLSNDTSGTAAKATNDVDGNAIKTTYAKLASPALIGTPTAPTASAGTKTTQIATTAFVDTALSNYGSDLVHKSGAETIAGTKSYTGKGIFINQVDVTNSVENHQNPLEFTDVNGVTISRLFVGKESTANFTKQYWCLFNQGGSGDYAGIKMSLSNNNKFTLEYLLDTDSSPTTIDLPVTDDSKKIPTTEWVRDATGNFACNAATATAFASSKSVTLTGDVTGTASSTAGWSVATTLANSGVTANSYGPSADASPTHGQDFTVPYFTVDAKGRITSASDKTITLPADNDTKNTAGSTDTSSKIYLIGATSQAANPQTYSHDTAYVGTDGCLYSNSTKVLTEHPSITIDTDTTSTSSPAHGGQFTCIDSITKDTNGHVTKINTKTVTLPADNNTDTLVTQNASTTNNNYPLLLCPTANASSNQGEKTAIFASSIKANPSTGTIDTTKLSSTRLSITNTLSGGYNNYSNSPLEITCDNANHAIVIKHNNITKGTAPSNTTSWGIRFTDSDGSNNKCLVGALYTTVDSNKTCITYLEAFDFNQTHGETPSNPATFGLVRKIDGTMYAFAPTTPATGISTDIITRGYIEGDDNNFVHKSGIETITGDKSFSKCVHSLETSVDVTNNSSSSATRKWAFDDKNDVTIGSFWVGREGLDKKNLMHWRMQVPDNNSAYGNLASFLTQTDTHTYSYVLEYAISNNTTDIVTIDLPSNAEGNQIPTCNWVRTATGNFACNAATATTATTATKATQDENGRNISTGYMWRSSYERISGTSSAHKDLNSYTSPGFYNVQTNYVDNVPTGIGAYATLLVYPWKTSGGGDGPTYVSQEITEAFSSSDCRRWIRKQNNGTWSSWKQVAFTDSNITGTAANVTGTVAIANGGTGATTRLDAIKALTNEDVSTNTTHFLGMKSDWSKVGYVSAADTKSVLGINATAGTSTLAWNSEVTLATVNSLAIKAKLPSNPNTDTKVRQDVGTTNVERPILSRYNTSDASQTANYVVYDTGVTNNPNTHTLTASGGFIGNLTGNADTSTIGKGVYFIIPNETSATATLTATVSGITALTPGMIFALRMPFSNSASSTLNINSIGAKPIYYSNTTTTASRIAANAVVLLVYEETTVSTGCFKIVHSYDSNTTYTLAKLGLGYAVQSNTASAAAVTATMTDYALLVNGIVAVKFTYNVLANSTLSINSKTAKYIFHKGAKIKANVIKANDVVTLVYDGTQYQVISIAPDIANGLDASGLTHDIPYYLLTGQTYPIKVSGVRNPYRDETITYSISSNNANITFSKSSNIALNEYITITVAANATLGTNTTFTLVFTGGTSSQTKTVTVS